MAQTTLVAGLDFGLTNIDIVSQTPAQRRRFSIPSNGPATVKELQRAIGETGREVGDYARIAVTGGRHRDLPDSLDGVGIFHADEMTAIGLGGLELTGLRKALVVSAGTGTAMVAARGGEVKHVTGTAVGGGTMLGLSRMLIRTVDPKQIDSLARAGDRNGVDLSIAEAIGQKIAGLPPDATAVNFGKLAREPKKSPSREDLAAAIITMVGQTISLIAINAARAEDLPNIVLVGHMMDMPSMRKACLDVADLYKVVFTIPINPGFATVVGAIAQLPT